MSVAVPFSPAFTLLVAALPAVWLLGRALAHAITADRALRAVLPLGVAPALWVLAVHVASLLGRSVYVGLPVGTLVLAAAGVAAEVRRRGRPGAPPEGEPPSRWMWITMALSAAALIPSAVGHSFHDELNFSGHMSFAAEIQDGIYPPRHPTFPAFPLRYHYGFDLVTACLTALFRLRVDQAIDAGTIGLWLPSWCLLWVLGERLAGRAAAWLTPPLVLLGGNVPLDCDNKGASLVTSIVEWCRFAGFPLTGPSIAYWFQHPWALATPIGVAAILIYTERRPPSERARLCTLALLLAVLSLAEAVLFVAMLPSLVVAEAYYEDRREPRRLGPMLGVAAFAGVSAKLLGGIFVSTPGLPQLGFTLQAGYTNELGNTLVWNLKSFGVRLLLGVAGLFVLRRGRLLLGLLLGGSMLVLNAVRYANTNDIVKFAHVAGIAAGILGAAALARLLPARPDARSRRGVARSVTAVALLGAATAASVGFLLAYAINHKDVPPYFRSQPETMSADDTQAIDWLRRRIRPGEVVYRRLASSLGYAQWGGLPQPWTNANTRAFGFPAEMLTARNKLLTDQPADLEAYRQQGFGWFVLDSSEPVLAEHAEAWIRKKGVRVATQVGGLRILEVLPAGGR